MTVNKAILVGRLGQDPEARTTTNGNTIVNLSLATTRRQKEGEQWVEATDWHRVVAFGRTAENVQRFCRKGKQVYIEGRIQTRKWQDKEGNDKYTTEIIANDVKFLGSKDEGGGGQGGTHGGGYGSRGGSAPAPATGGKVDDDIPFATYGIREGLS